MSIIFYFAPRSSASPVASALLELGVPHERVQFDLTKSDHKQPEFLKLNPNGKVPTLVVDGTPMFEGLAILLWLAESYGPACRLWPKQDEPARLQAYSWCSWAYVSYSALLSRLLHASSPRFAPELQNAAHAQLARDQLEGLLDILETRLSAQPFMLGEHYSLVDLIVASAVGYGVWVGAAIDAHPHVKAWVELFQTREAYRLGMEG